MGSKSGLDYLYYSDQEIIEADNFCKKIQAGNFYSNIHDLTEFVEKGTHLRDKAFLKFLLGRILAPSSGFIALVNSSQSGFKIPVKIPKVLSEELGWRNIWRSTQERTDIRNQAVAMFKDICQMLEKVSPSLVTAGLTGLALATGHHDLAKVGMVVTTGTGTKGLWGAFCTIFRRNNKAPLQTQPKSGYTHGT